MLKSIILSYDSMSRGKFGQEIFENSWIAWSLLQPRPNILRPRVSPLKLDLLSIFTKETSQKLQKYHPNLDFENSTVCSQEISHFH